MFEAISFYEFASMTMTPFTSLLQVLFKHLQEKLYVTEVCYVNGLHNLLQFSNFDL